MKAFKLVLVVSVFCFGSGVYAQEKGERIGNGGFAFKEAIHTLKFAQEDITVDGIDQMNEQCVNDKLAKNNLKPVSLAKLSTIIKNTRRNYTKTVLGTDSEGEVQPLMFTYGTDGKGPYIEALQLYFIEFMGDHNGVRYPDAEILLLHEAAHLFGYSEDEATQFADIITDLRNNTTGDRPGDCWK